MRVFFGLLLLAGLTLSGATAPEITIEIKDFAALPITGAIDGVGNSAGLLARVNFLREEPAGSKKRLFANDLNGSLYLFDRVTKQFSEYLNLNGAGDRKGLYHRTVIDNLLASGFISFEFDPDYARNGKFYKERPASRCSHPHQARVFQLADYEHAAWTCYSNGRRGWLFSSGQRQGQSAAIPAIPFLNPNKQND